MVDGVVAHVAARHSDHATRETVTRHQSTARAQCLHAVAQRGVAVAVYLGYGVGGEGDRASTDAQVVGHPGDVVVAVGHRALVDGVAAHVLTRHARHTAAEAVAHHQAAAGARSFNAVAQCGVCVAIDLGDRVRCQGNGAGGDIGRQVKRVEGVVTCISTRQAQSTHRQIDTVGHIRIVKRTCRCTSQ